MGFQTALWEKWVEFRHSWLRITMASLVSPLLYLIAFGMGMGAATVNGRPYIEFLIPGIIALTTMSTSYNAVALSLNVQRLYEHSFDQIVMSPTSLLEYILGQTFGGALRGFYAGCLVLLLSMLFGVRLQVNAAFFVVMLLNGMAFAALGVMAAILAKTHADVGRFSTFVITPMIFLCNTFFSLDTLPRWLAAVIGCLPLSLASGTLRTITYGGSVSAAAVGFLAIYLIAFEAAAYLSIMRKENI